MSVSPIFSVNVVRIVPCEQYWQLGYLTGSNISAVILSISRVRHYPLGRTGRGPYRFLSLFLFLGLLARDEIGSPGKLLWVLGQPSNFARIRPSCPT